MALLYRVDGPKHAQGHPMWVPLRRRRWVEVIGMCSSSIEGPALLAHA